MYEDYDEDFYDEPIGIPASFAGVDRREFLKAVGAGIIVFFTVADTSVLEAQQGSGEYPSDFNAYLRIREDGRVECFTGKIEMGQGIITSLAQMAADELDVSLDAVEMVMGDTALCPYDRGTFGSRTTRFFGPPLRSAAARARAVLLELAAEELKTPVDKLTVNEGVVSVSGRPGVNTTYARLAAGNKIARDITGNPVEKDPSAFNIIGKPELHRDGAAKVTGRALFAGDIRYPGMLYASILRPPAHRATLKSLDIATAEKVTGVKLIREDDLVAVLHEDPEIAYQTMRLLKAEWAIPDEPVDDRNIFEHLQAVAAQGDVEDSQGDIQQGSAGSAQVFDEIYYNSYVAHSPIEPHTAVADYRDGKIELWVSTQAPFRDKPNVAAALALPEENVRVRSPFVGGGFGGKTRNLQAVEAARLSKAVGRPVMVAWTREEEFFHDSFRPAAVVKIKSGIDKTGKITFWDYEVMYAGSRGAGQFYDVTNNRIVATGGGWGGAPGSHPFATGAWRGPGANTNVFAKESHIDIMAARAGIDPLEFRLKNLKDKRMIGVLEAVSEKFGWSPAAAPSGRGVGIACGVDSGTYVASMAEVEVDRASGRISVKRVVCAQDMGLMINPQGAKIQMEGCITMGLGYALAEEIHFKGGDVRDRNYDTYSLPRFSWLPEIETVILDRHDEPAQGGGEPAIVNMGGVLANAVYDAVGARLYQLPMTPERVLAALPA